jgi:cell division transport system permease protein
VRRLLLVALVLVVLGGVATVVVVRSRADRCEGQEVSVFLHPDVSDGQRSAVLAAIREIEPQVDYVDHEEAYEEFEELFEDNPDMLASVSPDDLPPSFVFRVDDLEPAVRRELRAFPGVRDVVDYDLCRDESDRRNPFGDRS